MKFASILLAVTLGAAPAAGQDVSRVYLEGRDAFEDGNYAEAIAKLEEAVSIQPEGGGRIRRGGAMLVDYTPYVMLAIAYGETGNCPRMFEAWQRGGGYNVVRGRAGDLRSRTDGIHDTCRDQLVAAARTTVSRLDTSELEALSRNQYVAPRWQAEFAAPYAQLTAAIGQLRASLDTLAQARPADPAAIEAVSQGVPALQSQITTLQRRVEVAAEPPAEPEPDPEPEPATPPPAAAPETPATEREATVVEPEPVSTPPVAAETSRNDREAPADPPSPPATSAPARTESAPVERPVDTGTLDVEQLEGRLDAAMTAFYRRGDLGSVLQQTEVANLDGPPELLWQLNVLRAAAYYTSFRLGVDDQGLTQATAVINRALDVLPAARPSSAHFAAGFVQAFESVAATRR